MPVQFLALRTPTFMVFSRPRLRPMAPITPLFSWNASAGDLVDEHVVENREVVYQCASAGAGV